MASFWTALEQLGPSPEEEEPRRVAGQQPGAPAGSLGAAPDRRLWPAPRRRSSSRQSCAGSSPGSASPQVHQRLASGGPWRSPAAAPARNAADADALAREGAVVMEGRLRTFEMRCAAQLDQLEDRCSARLGRLEDLAGGLADRLAQAESALRRLGAASPPPERPAEDQELLGALREVQEQLRALQQAERRLDARLEDHDARLQCQVQACGPRDGDAAGHRRDQEQLRALQQAERRLDARLEDHEARLAGLQHQVQACGLRLVVGSPTSKAGSPSEAPRWDDGAGGSTPPRAGDGAAALDVRGGGPGACAEAEPTPAPPSPAASAASSEPHFGCPGDGAQAGRRARRRLVGAEEMPAGPAPADLVDGAAAPCPSSPSSPSSPGLADRLVAERLPQEFSMATPAGPTASAAEQGSGAGSQPPSPARPAAAPQAGPPAGGGSPPPRAAGSAQRSSGGSPVAASHLSLPSPEAGPGGGAGAGGGGSPTRGAGSSSGGGSPGAASQLSLLSPGSQRRQRALVSLVEGALRPGGLAAAPEGS